MAVSGFFHLLLISNRLLIKKEEEEGKGKRDLSCLLSSSPSFLPLSLSREPVEGNRDPETNNRVTADGLSSLSLFLS